MTNEYEQLEEMHKLIEELRAKVTALDEAHAKLIDSIASHYSMIFQPAIKGGQG